MKRVHYFSYSKDLFMMSEKEDKSFYSHLEINLGQRKNSICNKFFMAAREEYANDAVGHA